MYEYFLGKFEISNKQLIQEFSIDILKYQILVLNHEI